MQTGFNIRIISSITGSISVAIISFLTSIVIARILSVDDFGLYQYMLSIGQSIVLLASLNMGNAYYTFISKRRYPSIYNYVFAFSQLLLFSVLIFLFLAFIKSILFYDLKLEFILVCLFGSFVFFSLRQQAIYILESHRKSLLLQILLVTFSLINLAVISYYGYKEILDIGTIFLSMSVVYFSLWVLTIQFIPISNSLKTAKISFKKEFVSYRNYIVPLILSMVVIQVGVIFDRWMLQTYSGSIEQAYFGISYRFAVIATILSASVVNIFWKEISSLIERNKSEEAIKLLIEWHSLVIKFILFACLFIFINAENLILLTYGEEYSGSVKTLKIMAFFPLLQTSVHLLTTYLFSDSLTSPIAKISIISSLLGMIFIFIFFSINFGISGSQIVGIKFLITSFSSAFLMAVYLKVLKKLWSSNFLFFQCPLIFSLIFISDVWLNKFELTNLSEIFFSGIIFFVIFVFYMISTRSLDSYNKIIR